MGVPKEGREKEAKRIYGDIMNENFPNLMKDMNINTQETQRTPSKMNSNRPTPKTHNNQTYTKPKNEKILKTAREK